jgi:uncharacterized membrane protein
MSAADGIIRIGTGVLAVTFVIGPWLRRQRVSETAVRSFQILLGLCLVSLHGSRLFGWPGILRFLAIAAAVGTAAEAMGLRFGWIFGHYRYSESVGPKCFGFLPLFVPILWAVLPYLGLVTACSAASLLSGGPWFFGLDDSMTGSAGRLVLSAAAVTAIDVVAEPIAVQEGRWFWQSGGRYYGIPFSNFSGWFWTSLAAITVWFMSGPVSIRLEEVPIDVLLLPAAGYGLFFLICSRVCFERKMRMAGWIGAVTGMVIFLVVFASYFSYYLKFSAARSAGSCYSICESLKTPLFGINLLYLLNY